MHVGWCRRVPLGPRANAWPARGNPGRSQRPRGRDTHRTCRGPSRRGGARTRGAVGAVGQREDRLARVAAPSMHVGHSPSVACGDGSSAPGRWFPGTAVHGSPCISCTRACWCERQQPPCRGLGVAATAGSWALDVQPSGPGLSRRRETVPRPDFKSRHPPCVAVSASREANAFVLFFSDCRFI